MPKSPAFIPTPLSPANNNGMATCVCCTSSISLIPRPHHAREERVWWHWRRFLVLQAQQSYDYLHRFVLAHVRSHDGAQDQENAPMPPDPFPSQRVGSGNETILACAMHRKLTFLSETDIHTYNVINMLSRIGCLALRRLVINYYFTILPLVFLIGVF